MTRSLENEHKNWEVSLPLTWKVRPTTASKAPSRVRESGRPALPERGVSGLHEAWGGGGRRAPEDDSTREAAGPRGTSLVLTWESCQNTGLFQKPTDMSLMSPRAHADSMGSLGWMSAWSSPQAPSPRSVAFLSKAEDHASLAEKANKSDNK